MQLPIQYPAPHKIKYLTEETTMFNHWMIFGEHPDGTVDIADSDQDIIQRVPKHIAEQVIEARSRFCNEMETLLRKTEPMLVKSNPVTKSCFLEIDQDLMISHKGNIEMLIDLIICYGAEHPEVEPLAGRLYETIFKTPTAE